MFAPLFVTESWTALATVLAVAQILVQKIPQKKLSIPRKI